MATNYFSVEMYVNGFCEETYQTDELSNAQANYDSWTSDFENDEEVEIKMFKYNAKKDEYTEIDYDGNVIK